VLKAYKYQIFPNNEQKTLIVKHFGCCRYVYNMGLAQKIEAYQTEKKSISRFDIQKQLPILKRTDGTEWLAEVQAQSLQASLEHLDKAYTRFFREKKGFPKFKSKHKKQSYQYPQGVKVNFETNKIFLPKIKEVDICLSRTFEGQIKTVTVSQSPTKKYYVSILVDNALALPPKPQLNESRAVGIDLGVKHFATLSDGTKIDNPKFLKNNLDRLRMLQRKASKKVKGSNNRKKANFKIAKQHEKITNLRNNFLHQITAKLIKDNQFDTFCIEDLNIAGMVKNHHLAQSISDASWGKFVEFLTYKSEWYGRNILTIGRFEPSSRLCRCGQLNKDLTLSDRVWTCKSCNTTHDRDILAANNIRHFAFNKQNTIPVGRPGINACRDEGLLSSMKQETTER
jgi:putative transposase